MTLRIASSGLTASTTIIVILLGMANHEPQISTSLRSVSSGLTSSMMIIVVILGTTIHEPREPIIRLRWNRACHIYHFPCS